MKGRIRQKKTKFWRDCFLSCSLVLCLLLASVLPVLASEGNTLQSQVSLTILSDQESLNGTQVRLYKVADFSPEGQYTLSGTYAGYLGGADFDGSDSGKLEGGAQTLEAYVRADGKAADIQTVIQDGSARLSDIPSGLYLILWDAPAKSDYTVGAQLQSLPYDFKDGEYVKDVTLHVKAMSKPGPEKTSYRVQKLWQGDEKADRPSEIAVTILKDGAVYQTVSLNADNNWSYSWEAESGVFLVKEDNIPAGYTVKTSSDGTTFQITNTRQRETQSQTPEQTTSAGQTSGGGPTPGQEVTYGTEQVTPAAQQQRTTGNGGTVSTGDHSRIFGWLFLMCVSGLALVTIGWRMARR